MERPPQVRPQATTEAPDQKSRFLGVLALLFLVVPHFVALHGAPLDPMVWVEVPAAVLVLAGLFWSPARPLSWWVVLAVGLGSVTLRPAMVEGLALVLSSMYVLVDTRFVQQRPSRAAVLFPFLLLGAQAVSLVLYPEDAAVALVQVLGMDVVVSILVYLFRREIFGRPSAALPPLNLRAFHLTDREVALVRALKAGQSPKELAFAQGLAIGALRMALWRVYGKLGVAGLKELLVLVHGHELVESTNETP